MLNVPEIGCVSVNYKTSSAELRGKLAFGEDKIRSVISRIIDMKAQSVILCTCCRTEIYYCGNCGQKAIINLFSEESGICADHLLPYLNVYKDEKAIRHLFRVAGGLSSPVKGEDEILHQVVKAYKLAVSCDAAGYEFNRCFQDAIACGKQIRSETFISQIPLSSATIAANIAASFGENVSVLIIGASGSIGSSVLKNLITHKNVSISATSRQHGNDIHFDRDVRVTDYNNRYKEAAVCDCVISATTSPHHTITMHELKANGISGKKLFIDLAVPADIDSEVKRYENFELIDIDYINDLAKQNSIEREHKAEAAAEIIDHCVEKLKKELLFHRNKKVLDIAAENMRANPRNTVFALKKSLDAKSFEAVIKILTEL